MPSKTQFPDFSEAADKQCRDYQSGDNWDMYDFRAVASVFTFTKECSGELLKVQMLVAATCPIEVILHFHSTCVMNVISWEKAYCLYPRATLEARCSLICNRKGCNMAIAMQKYEKRGWHFYESHDRDCRWGPSLRSCFHIQHKLLRWMGDPFCWTLELDTTQISDRLYPGGNSSPLPHDPVVTTSWKLRSDGHIDTKGRYSAHFHFPYLLYYNDSVGSFELSGSSFGPMKVMQRKFYDAQYISYIASYRHQTILTPVVMEDDYSDSD